LNGGVVVIALPLKAQGYGSKLSGLPQVAAQNFGQWSNSIYCSNFLGN